jgi:type IV pilus assembly protein PilM
MDRIGIFAVGEKIKLAHLCRVQKKIEIKQLVDDAAEVVKDAKVHSGLDAESIILRKLELKLKSRAAVRKVLPFQAEASVPYSPEETFLLPFIEKKGKDAFDIQLLATTKTAIQNHLETLNQKNFDPDATSCAPVALLRYARHFFPDEPNLFILHLAGEKSFCGLVLQGNLEQISTFSVPDGSLSLPLQKELDRAFSFLSKKTETPPQKLLLSGDIDIEALKEYLQTHFSCSILQAPYAPFAIPIGLALEGFVSTGKTVDLRQQEFVSPRVQKKRTKLALSYLLCCTALTLITVFATQFITQREEAKLHERLTLIPQTKNLHLKEKDIETALELSEAAFAKEKIPFSFLPTVPKASDVLAWVSSSPIFTDEIDVKEVHYQLVKYPKLGGAQEPYQAKVELKFTSSSPAAAKQFRDALMKGDDLVNPKQEIGWNVQQNLYQTSFTLKKKRV